MSTSTQSTDVMSASDAKSRSDHEHVYIFDTTLRDGEQSPGASMTLDEKFEVAQLLDQMGVDIIEAGFPIASEGDFEAVTQIAKRTQNAVVCGLARASDKDIDRAAQALRPAKQSRIHTFISTSPLHMKYKLKMEPETVFERVVSSVTRARHHTDNVEWSPEDGTRTEHDFLCRCVEAAIKAGATTINIPDTVGYAVPEEYYALIRMLYDRVPNMDKAILSTHCHDDLGLAVANSLAGVRAGARQVECTINGLGERAGNAALEEIVMGFRTREDALPYQTGIETTMLTKASRLVATVANSPVQNNKAIVGRNAFAHESGIHQDGMLKNAQTYEIMTPESVGLRQTNLVMGKHSGRHAFREKLKDMGYELADNAFQEAFERFKALADKKKQIFDDDLVALVDDEVATVNDRIKLVSMQVTSTTDGTSTCAMVLNVDGDEKKVTTRGIGAVDSIFNAIKEAVGASPHLLRYGVDAVTGGTDAQANASVRLEQGGKIAAGRASEPDTLVASARAYLHAYNKLLLIKGSAAQGALAEPA